MKKWSKWKRGIKERRGILCPLHTASNYWLFPVDPVMLISEPTRSINIICMSCLLIIVKFKLCFRIRDKLIVDKLAVQCIIALSSLFLFWRILQQQYTLLQLIFNILQSFFFFLDKYFIMCFINFLIIKFYGFLLQKKRSVIQQKIIKPTTVFILINSVTLRINCGYSR